MSSLGMEIFKLGYQISPIIMVNGIASQIPGQMLPIVAITEAANFTLGLLSGNGVPDLDQFFAHWKPLPGTTLISNQVATYPFANQAVAGNAIIAQPLTVSMLMDCPVQASGGYTTKLATLTVLQQTLLQHNAAGGTYTIATPSQIWTNCLLVSVRDVSGGDSKQVQHTWQFDFVQPLVTLNQAQQVYNSLMNKIAGGLPTSLTPSWSGLASTVTSAVTGAAGSITSTVSGLVGSASSTVSSAIGSVSSII
jgi:hypothetical protein